MEKCCASHIELHTEAKLGIMMNQGLFNQVSPLRVLGMVTLKVKVLKCVILWIFHK